jgi:ABC-type dipeptide/oligopeptide/nickel transport system permease component
VIAYIVRRMLFLVPVLVGVLAFVFLMRALVPGDPLEIMFLGQMPPDQATLTKLRHELGLDEPLPVQFVRYVAAIAHGDFGQSIRTRQPVTADLAYRYTNTLVLTFASLLVALVVGLSMGILAAVYRDTAIDVGTMVLAMFGLSMPAFWFGLIMIMVFAVDLRWLPVMGSAGPVYLVLPALTLGLIASTVIARITRSSMLDVLSAPYVRTARAKGLRERAVIIRHALRNALIPVVTILGLQLGGLLGGAFIIEVVFAWHGVGERAIQAISQRDFPVIQGITLIVAATYVLVNLLVDILYGLLDPRIVYE